MLCFIPLRQALTEPDTCLAASKSQQPFCPLPHRQGLQVNLRANLNLAFYMNVGITTMGLPFEEQRLLTAGLSA